MADSGGDDGFDVHGFAQAFTEFMMHVRSLVPPSGATLRDAVAAHLGVDPGTVSSVTRSFDPSELPNLQLALNALVASSTSAAQAIGLPSEIVHYSEFSLSGLLSGRFHGPAEVAPVEYVAVPIDVDRTLPCARLALYLVDTDGVPTVAMVSLGEQHGPRSGLRLEVMATEQPAAERFLERIGELMHEHNVYRGKVLSFSFNPWGGFGLTFHRLPAITSDEIILPPEDLDAIDRHTISIAERADALRAAHRHLKRGLLLYGPPGTGKTLSVMYLCNRMPGRTTILLSGPASGALGQAVAVARSLQPSMVVLEDVDLVAMERTMPGFDNNPLLFQLLNEMDGLAEDADVIFVLTTNRVELLEPALAARPGRIDQAVEIKLPDESCRDRLLNLYLRGVESALDDRTEVVTRTEGASAAFVKELVRRATLLAIETAGDGEAPVIKQEHMREALDDLLVRSAPILKSMLGAEPSAAAVARLGMPVFGDEHGGVGWVATQVSFEDG